MSANATTSATRTEKDSLGTKEIPAHVYYGIQTACARIPRLSEPLAW
jgi:hypothetical protein